MKPSDLYAIRAGASGPIKIGSSDNIQARLRGFQTGHYESLELVRSAENAGGHESKVHSLIEPFRVRGEWFEINDELCERLFSSLSDPSFVESANAFSELSPRIREQLLRMVSEREIIECALSGNLLSMIDEAIESLVPVRLGRPRLKESERRRRTNRLTIMLWPHERIELERAAGSQDVSTWLRELGLKAAQ